jgi:hypothetical protein
VRLVWNILCVKIPLVDAYIYENRYQSRFRRLVADIFFIFYTSAESAPVAANKYAAGYQPALAGAYS